MGAGEQLEHVLAAEAEVAADGPQARELAGRGPVDHGALGHVEELGDLVAAQQLLTLG